MEFITGADPSKELVTAQVNWLFWGTVGAGPVASQNAQVQLFNPLAGNRSVYVLRATAGVSVAGVVQWGFYNTALLTDGGTGFTTNGDNNASNEHMYSNTAVGLLGTNRAGLYIPINGSLDLVLPWTIVLQPGQGFAVGQQVANGALQVNFIWAVGV